MSLPITEIAIVPLHSHKGVNWDSQVAEERKLIDEVVKTVASQPGARNVAFGPKLEDENVAIMLVDWDTKEDHIKFIKSEAYPGFRELISQAATLSDIKILHSRPSKAVQTPLGAPVTEIATWYFEADSVPEDFPQIWEGFLQKVDAYNVPGAVDQASGWIDGEVDFKTLEGEPKKGKGFIAYIGWESREHHMRFRETPKFAELMPEIRKHISGVEMFHVDVKKKTW